MKKNIIIYLFFLFPFSVIGQDTTKTASFFIEYEYSFANFTNQPNNYSYDYSNSGSPGLNLKYAIKLKKSFYIVPGISFSFNTIGSNIGFNNVNDITEIETLQKDTYYQNNFNFYLVSIPVLFQYRTKANKKNLYFAIDAGVNTGLLFYNDYSFSTKTGNIINTVTEIKNENINPVQYSFVGRINMLKSKKIFNRKIGLLLFLRYEHSFSKLFKNDKGPDIGFNKIGFGVGVFF